MCIRGSGNCGLALLRIGKHWQIADVHFFSEVLYGDSVSIPLPKASTCWGYLKKDGEEFVRKKINQVIMKQILNGHGWQAVRSQVDEICRAVRRVRH